MQAELYDSMELLDSCMITEHVKEYKLSDEIWPFKNTNYKMKYGLLFFIFYFFFYFFTMQCNVPKIIQN